MKRYFYTTSAALVIIFAFVLLERCFLIGRMENEQFGFFSASGIYTEQDSKKSIYKEKEMLLFNYIDRQLLGLDGGIITNTMTGNVDYDTLCESVGLLMNYAVISGRKDLFDLEASFLNDNLLTEGNKVKWKTGSEITCNASIDDLRVVRAFINAYERWGEKEYLHKAHVISKNILETQVIENGLHEVHDWKYETSRPSTPLCYLDLYTIHKISTFDTRWKRVFDKSMGIIKGGKIGNSPFYNKYYHYESDKYSLDEEYDKNKGVCVTYTLITSINMAQAGVDKGLLREWLEDEMKDGRLYAWYNPYKLEPISEVESTAVYALASIYAKLSGDDKLSKKLLDRMLEFMITDENSKYYGGFGNSHSGEFYSFDNLTALWALAK
jgi:endo-1,4-beta-D-glucanase Y